MNYNINGIIKFQRMYKFMKNEFEIYNYKIVELCEVLHEMYDNLSKINELKLFENNKDTYNLIFYDIENLTKKFNKLPNNLTFKTFKESKNSMDDLNVNIYNLSRELDLYMNYISPSDLRLTLIKLYGKEFYYKFSYEDYNLLVLIEKILIPINIWDSDIHKDKVEHLKNLNTRKIMKRDSIDKLLDIDENSTSLIVSDQSLPIFLNKLSEYIVKEGNKGTERITMFDKDDVKEMFLNKPLDILITANYLNKSFIENFRGIIVHIRVSDNKYICIQGLLKNDNFEMFKNYKIITNKLCDIKKHINYNILTVPKKFKNTYMNNISLKEILTGDNDSISNNLKNKNNKYKKLKNKNLKILINDFLLSSKHRKVDTLLTLLYSQEDNMLAYLLYDIMVIKDKKNITPDILNALPIRLRNDLDIGKEELLKSEKDLMNVDVSDISYERRISLLDTTENIKSKAISKLKSIKNNMQGDSKAQDWLDGLLKIPFGIYKTNNVIIDLNNHTLKQSEKHAFQQRFYANIELANSPFIPKQGPGDFKGSGTFKPSKNVLVMNGTLGRTSHHGIHANSATNIILYNLDITNFEVAGIALTNLMS